MDRYNKEEDFNRDPREGYEDVIGVSGFEQEENRVEPPKKEVHIPSREEAVRDAERNLLGKYVAPATILATALVTLLEAAGYDIFSVDDLTNILLSLVVLAATAVSLYGVFKNNDYTVRAKQRTKVADQVVPRTFDKEVREKPEEQGHSGEEK